MDELILKNRDDILGPLTVMSLASVKLHEEVPSTILESISSMLRRAQSEHLTLAIQTEWAHHWFGLMGVYATKLLCLHGQKAETFQEPFIAMLLEKHKRYGARPIRAWGSIGIMIRIHSKWERYLNLREQPELDGGDESMIDTLRDILGYCVIGVKLTEGA